MVQGAHLSGSEAAVHTYRYLMNNWFTRRTLRYLSKHCEKDGGNRLEVALEMFVGVRKEACTGCRLASLIVKPFLRTSSRSFGSNEEQLRIRFKNPYWRRGLVSVIKGLGWFGVRRPYVPGAPFQVVWNVTKACNLKCKHCYADAGLPEKIEMSTEQAFRTIDILADAGVLILAFSGGEPTIRPDILQLMRYAHDRGIYVAVATNAMLFSAREKVREFKKSGLEFVQISLDGISPQSHDSFRGVRGSFDKTVEGIRNCVEEGLFVEVATTATKYNYNEIPGIVDFAAQLGANWFMMYNFVPTGRGVDIIDADLNPAEREDLLKVLWQKMKTKKINVLSTAPQFAKVAQEVESRDGDSVMPTHFYNPTLSGNLMKLADFIGGCGAGRFYISLEPNGDIYPCVFFPRDEQVKLGNILNVDFEDMWRNSQFLWNLRDKDILKAKCGSCNYRYSCGGCRARAYNYFGDVLAPDPGCTFNAQYWIDLKNHSRELETQAPAR